MATESAQPEMKESVGQTLQKAREKAGLSSADIASAQHLRPAVIQAIEAGDYSQIDSELFLKGYVRAYAEHVGLSADVVIAALDQELEPIRQQRAQEQEANPLVDIERRRRRKRRFAKALFFLVILGVAGYLAFTFVVPQQDESPFEPVTDSEAEQDSRDDADESAAVPEPEQSEPEVIVSSEESASTAMPSESVAPEAQSVEADAGERQPVEDSVADEDARQEPVDVVSDQIPTVVQTTEPVLENSVAVSEADDTGRLQISFSDDCWVQVVDAAGNRMVNSLQRDGGQIDVAGPAPLRVVIGAVNAVESIRFQGEPLDIDGYQVINNRSEFTLTL